MIMIRLLALALSFAAASWSSAWACSPSPPIATTEYSYEESLKPYLIPVHRNMVDDAKYIVIGQFKYSKRDQTHTLKISDVLKADFHLKTNKKVNVTFRDIDDDRVTYLKRKDVSFYNDTAKTLIKPVYRAYGIEGTYGPGDCGISLEIAAKTNYLIFANKEFEISSMLPISEKTLPFQKAVETMIKDPKDQYGFSRSLEQILLSGTKIKLINTESCTPIPTYKTISSSVSNEEAKIWTSKPILVFNDDENKWHHELTAEDYERARNLGFIQGRYTNAPELSTCIIGQKYLSLGDFIYSSSSKNYGQMIPEQSGYFNLTNTVFEHHITPSDVSLEQVSELIEAYQ